MRTGSRRPLSKEAQAERIAKFKATMAAKRKPVERGINLHAMAKRVSIAYRAELEKTGELTDLIVAAHVLCKAILGD